MLDSDTFLEQTISHLLGDKCQPFTLRLPLKPRGTSETVDSILKGKRTGQEMADYIGQIVWENMLEQDVNYVSAFISGMQAADKEPQRSPTNDRAEEFARIQPIRDLIQTTQVNDARRNVAEGDASLQSIAQSSGIHEIVPLKLYYLIVKNGQGPKLTVNHGNVNMQFTLSYLAGQKAGCPIASSPSMEVKLAELISGLAHGILGMQQGEIRELYIHSDYAYGCRAHFEPGIALSARVELLRLGRETLTSHFPALVPVDQGVADLALATEGEAMNQLCQKAAYVEGYSAWSFYRLGNDLYSLEDVIKSLQRRAGGSNTGIAMERDPILENIVPLLYQRQSVKMD